MITSLPRLRDHKANVGDIVPRLAADRRKKVRYIVPCWEECQALGLGMKYTCKSPLQKCKWQLTKSSFKGKTANKRAS